VIRSGRTSFGSDAQRGEGGAPKNETRETRGRKREEKMSSLPLFLAPLIKIQRETIAKEEQRKLKNQSCSLKLTEIARFFKGIHRKTRSKDRVIAMRRDRRQHLEQRRLGGYIDQSLKWQYVKRIGVSRSIGSA